MDDGPSQEELEAAHCWEADDRVPRRPEMTDFRRRARLHQARWREARGHPIGTQPIRPQPGKRSRLVGSRLPLEYARESGATFLTSAARAAAEARLALGEAHQTIDVQGIWADLLSSVTMTFNLFGTLAADPALADRAVHTWWPDVPGRVVEVRFKHSPGRLDMSYLGSLGNFSAAFVLDLGAGTQGILGVTSRYHERERPQPPKPHRVAHYLAISGRAGAHGPQEVDPVNGTDLIHVWLDHMLVHSMLQHPDDRWGWGRLVLVHPEGNTDAAGAGTRYEALLADTSTFAVATMEALLDAEALPTATASALRDRYVVR